MLMRPYFARGRMAVPRRSMLAPRIVGSRLPRYARPSVQRFRGPAMIRPRAFLPVSAPPRRTPLRRFARGLARVVGSLPTIRRYR